MQTDELQARRELDVLVAEKVMGWPVYRARRSKTTGEYVAGPIFDKQRYLVLGDELRLYSRTNEELLGRRWHPSEDIAVAWEVVEKARLVVRPSLLRGSKLQWIAGRLKAVRAGGLVEIVAETYTEAETAPLAICRAALKAVEETGWVTEPGWQYCDRGYYAHVCKPNQAPVRAKWLRDEEGGLSGIGCPECLASLSAEEAKRLADQCES